MSNKLQRFTFTFILMLSVWKTSCGQFKIKASLNGFTENSKVIIKNSTTGKILDSTQIKNNTFKANGFLSEVPAMVDI